VTLFAGLGLLYTLITSLVFPSNWEYFYLQADGVLTWPLSQPLELLPRLGIALLTAICVVWLLRPGQRTLLEFVLGAGCLLAYAALVAYSYDLTGVVLVVPVVLRAWWPLRHTLLVSLPLLLVALAFNLGYLPGTTLPLGGAESLTQSVIYLAGQGMFAFIAFELTLRREEERAQLRQALSELHQYHDLELQHALLEERARVSRDLHDTLGHSLTALRFELQRARKVQADPVTLTDSLGRALDRSGEAMGSLQAAVKAIRPQGLSTSLLGAVSELVRAWPHPVKLTLPSEEPVLSASARLAAFRCVQEGRTNAQKHAPEETLTVELWVQSTTLMLMLCNLLPAQEACLDSPISSGGLGLPGLHERVQDVGGQLTAELHDGVFQLQATFPLEEM